MASFQEMRGGPHEADSQHRKPDPPPRKALRGDDPGATLKSAVRTAWSAVALVSMWVLASASWFAQVNATLLPMEKWLGAVAPGHYADIVALQGDPLADINVVLKGVRWVMKGGHVVVNRTETA
jgi:imidazolonepropionase-like amidohydrolase